MVINNITGTNSLRSNCQPDESSSILSNVHEFISMCQDLPTDTNGVSLVQSMPSGNDDVSLYAEVQWETDGLSSMILFEPEDDDDICSSTDIQPRTGETMDSDSEFLETNVELSQLEVGSFDATWVVQNFFRTTSCKECRENFDLTDRNATLVSIQRLIEHLNSKIADICSEESLKAKLHASVEGLKVHVIGCSDHTDVIERKVKFLSVDRVVLTFCNNINKILSGKIESLPDKATPIQKLAFQHRIKKKGIGKHSDKLDFD